MSKLEKAVDAIIKAWTVEGIKPEYHRTAKASLRYNWPALAKAIEKLVEERKHDHNQG